MTYRSIKGRSGDGGEFVVLARLGASHHLVVPGRLETWNDAWGRTRFTRDKITKRWTQLVWVALTQAGMQFVKVQPPFEVEIARFGQVAVDVDNVMVKPVIDGLKYAGTIPDDRPDFFRKLTVVSLRCPKAEQRVELTLTEL